MSYTVYQERSNGCFKNNRYFFFIIIENRYDILVIANSFIQAVNNEFDKNDYKSIFKLFRTAVSNKEYRPVIFNLDYSERDI